MYIIVLDVDIFRNFSENYLTSVSSVEANIRV